MDNQYIKPPETVLKFCYELCRELKKSGTGEEKLDLLRAVLLKNRNATALEGLAVLEEQRTAGRLSQVTLEKARSLVFKGELPASETKSYEPVEEAIARQNAEKPQHKPQQKANALPG